MKKGKSGRNGRQIYTVSIRKGKIREIAGKGQKTKKKIKGKTREKVREREEKDVKI